MLRAVPAAVCLAILAAWYSSSRLCAALEPGSAWRWVVRAALALTWAFPLARLLSRGRRQFNRLWHAGFFILGLAISFLIGLAAMDLLGLILRVLGLAWPALAPWYLAGICLLGNLWGLRMALQVPGVVRVSIRHKGLHPALEGLRIVQLSDMHISSVLGRDYVQAVVEEVLALKPDLIAITGDLVDGPREKLQDAVAPLAGLKAPWGVFYVTGNHEYIWGAKAWVEDLKALGLQVLDNAHQVLHKGEATLLVIGISDLSAARMGSTDRPDVAKAMQGAPQADFRLFLAHQPKAWKEAHRAGADLMLAGHTHAGQFFPFQGIVSLFHRYFNGLYRHEDAFWVYVHAGSGYMGPPSRLGVPKEIALLELTAL